MQVEVQSTNVKISCDLKAQGPPHDQVANPQTDDRQRGAQLTTKLNVYLNIYLTIQCMQVGN